MGTRLTSDRGRIDCIKAARQQACAPTPPPTPPLALSPAAETFSPKTAPPPPAPKPTPRVTRLTLAALKKNTAPTSTTVPIQTDDPSYADLCLTQPQMQRKNEDDFLDPARSVMFSGIYNFKKGVDLQIAQIGRILRDAGTTTSDGDFTDAISFAKWTEKGLAVQFKFPGGRDGFLRIVGESLKDPQYNNKFHEIRFRGQYISVRAWEDRSAYQDRFRTGRGGAGKGRGRWGFGGQY